MGKTCLINVELINVNQQALASLSNTLAKRLFKPLAKQLDNVSESTEHVSELDISETTDYQTPCH